jgi:hypothetical protein
MNPSLPVELGFGKAAFAVIGKLFALEVGLGLVEPAT